MAAPTTTHSTFQIERTFPQPPARVFAAFAEPGKRRRWFAGPQAVDLYELDFRVGGVERLRSRLGADTPFPGAVLESVGTHFDIDPEQRIVLAQTMDLAGRRISAALATFELVAAPGGTRLLFTHQGAFFEGADGPQRREHGWGAILERLAAVAASS